MSKTNSKDESGSPKVEDRREVVLKECRMSLPAKELQSKLEKLASGGSKDSDKEVEKEVKQEKEVKVDKEVKKVEEKAKGEVNAKSEESNGVGDKIKKFEKAAEDAGASSGKVSRANSVRRRPSGERDDLPPPPPVRDFDTVKTHFQTPPQEKVPGKTVVNPTKNASSIGAKWEKSVANDMEKIKRPEPQKIIKPEFKPMPSPVDVTIRSPSLGAKIADQFPSHGTAFRNVASPDTARNNDPHNDVNTQNNVKACGKIKKEKYSISKGSSYFTRGSEEIWLVKKKDIEEIEERVLDSFRRAGGNVCLSGSTRPSSDSGGLTGAQTLARSRRGGYSRSESLDGRGGNVRAHTLTRQASAACTCAHERAKTRVSTAEPARPRSRSHGDDHHDQAHVLDKYETLV